MAAWRRERPHSFEEALKVAREILGASNELVAKGTIDTEAEQLVMAAVRTASGRMISRGELYLRIKDRYPDVAGEKLLSLAGTRAEGKPLQHLTGVQVFLEHEYEVGPDVLVPRPETEFLVVTALEQLAQAETAPLLGLEIGLGSGVISTELLSALPGLRMIASELTAEAEARARANARRILGDEPARERLKIVRASGPLEVWQPLDRELGGKKADFLISNPPYLAATDPIDEEVVRHEPATALFAPASDLLHFYREIAISGARYLRPGAYFFGELAPERSGEIVELFKKSAWSAQVLEDLAGRDRVLVATLKRKG